jgi:hypothetical protein
MILPSQGDRWIEWLKNLTATLPDASDGFTVYDADFRETAIKFDSRAEADDIIAMFQIVDVYAKLQRWTPDSVPLVPIGALSSLGWLQRMTREKMAVSVRKGKHSLDDVFAETFEFVNLGG